MWDSQDLQLQLFEPLAVHFGAYPREGFSWTLKIGFRYPKSPWLIIVLPIQIAVLGIFRVYSRFLTDRLNSWQLTRIKLDLDSNELLGPVPGAKIRMLQDQQS
jgi:hypothetical protein